MRVELLYRHRPFFPAMKHWPHTRRCRACGLLHPVEGQPNCEVPDSIPGQGELTSLSRKQMVQLFSSTESASECPGSIEWTLAAVSGPEIGLNHDNKHIATLESIVNCEVWPPARYTVETKVHALHLYKISEGPCCYISDLGEKLIALRNICSSSHTRFSVERVVQNTTPRDSTPGTHYIVSLVSQVEAPEPFRLCFILNFAEVIFQLQ